MKILLVILRFNKPNMKLSQWWRRGKLNLCLPVTFTPSPSAESDCRRLSFTEAETRPSVQSESLLMKAGSNYLLDSPPTKGSCQWRRDEIWTHLSRHHSVETNSVCVTRRGTEEDDVTRGLLQVGYQEEKIHKRWLKRRPSFIQ